MGPSRVGAQTCKRWPRRVGGPKFCTFFSFSRRKFHSFFSLGGLPVEFWLSCEAPAARQERKKIVAGEGKKRAKCWAIRPRGGLGEGGGAGDKKRKKKGPQFCFILCLFLLWKINFWSSQQGPNKKKGQHLTRAKQKNSKTQQTPSKTQQNTKHTPNTHQHKPRHTLTHTHTHTNTADTHTHICTHTQNQRFRQIGLSRSGPSRPKKSGHQKMA